ncbi:iron-containing alcohol dehydrogenase [Pseudovibrio sp. SPO723]|uniref:iron-containing alcohol dehydrogenase n=1 Tax=Nesiotobacter zosterae TaxID=392721 RepID=UPI0029C3B674|nr:iron-containing alcohol dehydrogenase [Pseudovibrio sp. SPO723]MDX5594592.1 iron-containing alcohol dehydrogenase [Pseudovibrio sp. SPO723]
MGFQFETVPLIVNENGAAGRLSELIKTRFSCKRVAIITDAGVVETGLVKSVVSALTKGGFNPIVFDGVEPDPSEQIVLEAASFAKANDADCIVGLGGGSSMDTAKMVAVLCCSLQPLHALYGIGKVEGKRLQLIQVPTTAGTGSEVTPIAILTREDHSKMGIVSPQLYADVAVLDPELTTKLPAEVTAATGIDAMVHAIEAYTSLHQKNPISDALAREALRQLWTHIRAAYMDGGDIPARSGMLLGAMMAGQAFANSPVAAVHALAYPIGGQFHVPHGLSNALILPHVLRFNLPEAKHHYAELAEVILPNISGSVDEKAAGFIRALENLCFELGIPDHLSQVGIEANDLPKLAKAAMDQTRLLVNNPRRVSYDDALSIYREAL